MMTSLHDRGLPTVYIHCIHHCCMLRKEPSSHHSMDTVMIIACSIKTVFIMLGEHHARITVMLYTLHYIYHFTYRL